MSDITVEDLKKNKEFLDYLKDSPEYSDLHTHLTKDIFLDITIFNALMNVYKIFIGGKNMPSIAIVNPPTNHSVKCGTDGTIVVAVTQSDITNVMNSCRVFIRNNEGKDIWKGMVKFSQGNAEFKVTWPTSPGNYTIEAQCVSIWGFVNALANREFTAETSMLG